MLREALYPLLDRLEVCDTADRRELITQIKRHLEIAEMLGEDGCYPLDTFISRLAMARHGKVYGYMTAYIEASLGCDHPADENLFRHWRQSHRVPSIYVDQIDEMIFQKKPPYIRRQNWEQNEIDFLADTYAANPKTTNHHLARCCSIEFGRVITESAIKGQLNRLRDEGRVSGYRRNFREVTESEVEHAESA